MPLSHSRQAREVLEVLVVQFILVIAQHVQQHSVVPACLSTVRRHLHQSLHLWSSRLCHVAHISQADIVLLDLAFVAESLQFLSTQSKKGMNHAAVA
jgi:hypothetical protein